MRSFTPVAILLLWFCTPTKGQRPAEKNFEAFVDSIVMHGMKKYGIPGAGIIVIQNGKVVVKKAYGYADVQNKISFSAEKSIFPIASITKVVTATAIMQLYEQEKISLSSDINKYLRSLQIPSTFPQPVSIHHLLTHTAGFDEIPGRQIEDLKQQKPLSVFLKDKLVRFIPPGKMSAYGSYGLSVGGLLIEDVSGKSYDEYLQNHIFQPLNMRHSYVQAVPKHQLKNLVKAYEKQGGKLVEVPYEIYQTSPVSSIVSTLPDVTNFMLMHLQKGEWNNQRILSSKTATLMQTQQETMHPDIPGFAYGWQVNDMNGEYIIEHGGDIGGFSALMSLLPEKKMGIFFIQHLEGNNLRFEIKKSILDRLYPDHRQFTKPVPIPDPNLSRFAGTYRANIYCHTCANPRNLQEFDVKVNSDSTLSLWNTRWVQTKPLLFTSEDGKSKLGFKEDENGKVICASGGSWRVIEKIN
jgi:CubicO group peptidase (beta-lactamase class C family)